MSALIKVRVDWDNVEATASLGERLSNTDPLTRSDLLIDIISDLKVYYEDAIAEFYGEPDDSKD